MSEPAAESIPHLDDEATRWFRFSLKSLFILMALVAVYFAGRASTQPNWGAPDAGTWQMNLPLGHRALIALIKLPDGTYLLDHGTSSNLGGKYRWKRGQLQVFEPNDSRFTNLAWQWDGDDLVLVAEPAGRPAGATYLGTRLKFSSPDIAAKAGPRATTSRPPAAAQRQKLARSATLAVSRMPVFEPTPWRDPPPGAWGLTLPAGFKRKAKLIKLDYGKYELSTGGVFNGTYQVRNDQLEVVAPDDPRMLGLTWAWNKDELVLISEPSPSPTGATYLGARLRQSEVQE